MRQKRFCQFAALQWQASPQPKNDWCNQRPEQPDRRRHSQVKQKARLRTASTSNEKTRRSGQQRKQQPAANNSQPMPSLPALPRKHAVVVSYSLVFYFAQDFLSFSLTARRQSLFALQVYLTEYGCRRIKCNEACQIGYKALFERDGFYWLNALTAFQAVPVW